MTNLITKVAATTAGTLFLGLLSVNPVSAFGVTTYQLDNYTVTANNTEPGLVIRTQEILPEPTTFTLNEGQSVSYNLFRIWTDETDVESGEDTVARPISVTFNFSAPPALSGGVATGTTVGQRTLLGAVQNGRVTWTNPTVLNYGLGGQLNISLSNATFNRGLLGLNEGQANGANVRATFTNVRTEVPEPLTLLGSAIALGFGAYTKKKLAKNNQHTTKQRQTV